MSKASEWALEMKATKRRLTQLERDEVPSLYFDDGTLSRGTLVAWVDEDGSPYFEAIRGRCDRWNAIKLAKWILDTFSDEPTR